MYVCIMNMEQLILLEQAIAKIKKALKGRAMPK